VRLFLAIKPTRPAEAQIARVLLKLQEVAGPAAAALKWTPAANVHATLHFLGEVNPTRVSRLRELLGPPLEERPFDVTLGRAGVFPPTGSPRVIWLDIVAGADEVSRVQAELGRRLAKDGFAVDARPFTPHLTVARVRDRDRAQARNIRELLQRVEDTRITWHADRVTLFRSDLGGPVPRYEEVVELELTAHDL
jgi:2'-5' RNA ligase